MDRITTSQMQEWIAYVDRFSEGKANCVIEITKRGMDFRVDQSRGKNTVIENYMLTWRDITGMRSLQPVLLKLEEMVVSVAEELEKPPAPAPRRGGSGR